jgi:hypothetical protein
MRSAALSRSLNASSRPQMSATTSAAMPSERWERASARAFASGDPSASAASTASTATWVARTSSGRSRSSGQTRSNWRRWCTRIAWPSVEARAPPDARPIPSASAHAALRSRQSPVATSERMAAHTADSRESPRASASASSASARWRLASARMSPASAGWGSACVAEVSVWPFGPATAMASRGHSATYHESGLRAGALPVACGVAGGFRATPRVPAIRRMVEPARRWTRLMASPRVSDLRRSARSRRIVPGRRTATPTGSPGRVSPRQRPPRPHRPPLRAPRHRAPRGATR